MIDRDDAGRPITNNETIGAQGINNSQGINGQGVQGLVITSGAAGSQGPGFQSIAGEFRNNCHSNGLIGVLGTIFQSDAQNTSAVTGLNLSNHAASYGVSGQSTNGVGVYGISTGGIGVQGSSTANHGLVGSTQSTDGHGGLVCYGALEVRAGSLTVVGGPKNAAVPHPDGTHRLVYCTESPESWFEDFGFGTLANGVAKIAIDPHFAPLIHTDAYHVFLSERDGHNDLFVSNVTPTGFEVHAAKNSTTAIGTFSYRLVAKRADIEAPRLAVYTPSPKMQVPTVPPPVRHLEQERKRIQASNARRVTGDKGASKSMR